MKKLQSFTTAVAILLMASCLPAVAGTTESYPRIAIVGSAYAAGAAIGGGLAFGATRNVQLTLAGGGVGALALGSYVNTRWGNSIDSTWGEFKNKMKAMVGL